jgi:hypothetical protein
MSSYQATWKEAPSWEDWLQRYPEWVVGFDSWAQQEYEERNWRVSLPQPLELLERVSQRTDKRPRVFISHRQGDEEYANRIAELADDAGFDFWLDTVDMPVPAQISNMSAKAIAAIIEMGLLNSSHLVAVYTDRSPGSTWIPYEYGRVKQPVLRSTQVTAWKYVSDPRTVVVPEWLSLNPVQSSELDLKTWFFSEMTKWQSKYSSCLTKPAGNWHVLTKPLPP